MKHSSITIGAVAIFMLIAAPIGCASGDSGQSRVVGIYRSCAVYAGANPAMVGRKFFLYYGPAGWFGWKEQSKMVTRPWFCGLFRLLI